MFSTLFFSAEIYAYNVVRNLVMLFTVVVSNRFDSCTEVVRICRYFICWIYSSNTKQVLIKSLGIIMQVTILLSLAEFILITDFVSMNERIRSIDY